MRVLAVHDRVGHTLGDAVQDEVEGDLGERGVEAAVTDRRGIADPPHLRGSDHRA